MDDKNLDYLANKCANYSVILEPDKNEADWWAGAPSVCFDSDSGKFFLAARMRTADAPRGRRGYEVKILESVDGVQFHEILKIPRESVPLMGFERPALVKNPINGKFILFGCGELENGWGIWRMNEVNHPSQIDATTFKPVLTAESSDRNFANEQNHHSTFRVQYKDPFIFTIGTVFHMFVIGFDRVERPYHFISNDLGNSWQIAQSRPVMESDGWHNFFTRPACVLPLAVGYLFVYEGSTVDWWDPTYNIATGLAYSPDLKIFYDLTPNSPLFKSTTPSIYTTWRYSHWIQVKNEIFVYFEAARPNKSNEIRLARFPAFSN